MAAEYNNHIFVEESYSGYPAVYELIDEMVKKELETVSAKDRNKWRETDDLDNLKSM